MDEPLAEYRRYHNRKTFLHRDGLGSVTAVSNAAGQVAYRSTYKAFGQMNRGTYDVAPTRLGYTGRELSVGGLMQYRSRYYEPGAGRFLQQDSFRGSTLAPPSLHRYVYVHNNPVRYVDPTGHSVNLHVEAFIAMTMIASIAFIAFCLVRHASAGQTASCAWRAYVAFFGSVPSLFSTVSALNLLGSVVDILTMWLDGTLDDWAVSFMLFSTTLGALLVYRLQQYLTANPVEPVLQGAIVLWLWSMINIFLTILKQKLVETHPADEPPWP
jgi:RHS repeat-associated protein